MTFSNNGVAQLWLEDQNLITIQTSGGGTIPLTTSIDHPHGDWDFTNNTLIDKGYDDQSDTASPRQCQRTNATYILLYAFDADSPLLRTRQEHLDAYRQQGLADNSRQVASETLYVMGLEWMLETELGYKLLDVQQDIQHTSHHRFGRMAQESAHGYYIDVHMEVLSHEANRGVQSSDLLRDKKCFDLIAYFASAMEHGIIEQLQSTNAVGASSVKMLLLSSTNATRKVFKATSANWAAVEPQLANYDTNGLASYINAGFTLLLPQDGGLNVSGAGSWAGYGLVAKLDITNSDGNLEEQMSMLIGGGYHGGFSADPGGQPDPGSTAQQNSGGQYSYDPNGPQNTSSSGSDPVDMASGAFTMNQVDLSAGQPEPRGFTFARNYNSARRHHASAGLPGGWTHSYAFNLSEISAAELALGRSTPAQMAGMIVATRAAYELYDISGSPKNWAVISLIAKWGVDQLIKNSVSITLGKDTLQFIKQPDGSLTPPANSTMSLAKSGAVYNLQERHGNTFKFDSFGRLTNVVDQYSQSLNLTYGTGASSNLVTQVSDWKNRTLTFGYGGSPLRLITVSNSAGPFVTFGYTTNAGQLDLSSVTDPEGKTSTLLYDTNHQIIASKDALSRTVVSNAFDAFGRVTTQYSQGDTNKAWQLFWNGFVNVEQDPTGSERRFFFDDRSRQIAVQDALGNVTQTVYDGQDHVVAAVSPLNETNLAFFDASHNLVVSVDALGFTNTFVYDGSNNLVQSIDPRGGANRFGYNSKFQLTASTNGAGDWATSIYSSTDGTLSSRTDSAGATTYGYDSLGQLNKVTHDGLGAEGYLNNNLGDVLSATNGRGFVTSYQYNQRRQLTNSIFPTNLTSKITFDAAGNVASTVDRRGLTTSNTWSPTGKLLATILPSPTAGSTPVITNSFDTRDWLSRTLNPLQQATSFTSDAAGRIIATTDALQRSVRVAYDADGRKTFVTNAAFEVARQEWSRRGELLRALDPATNIVNRVYDSAGNQIYLTNRNGKRWQFQFDAANRLTNTITPLNRQTSQTYNDRGLPATVREPSLQGTTNLYDMRGRLTNRSDLVATTLYSYDPNINLTNVVEAGKTNSWTFDAYDRVSSYKDSEGNLIQYRWDPNGNLTNLIYPGGKTVSYFYDGLNRLTNVTDWATRKTTFTYDLASRLTSITRPNGTIRTIYYDAAGETTNIIEQAASGAPIAFFKFGFDNAARVKWELAAPVPHTNAAATRIMTFDDDNRLATFNSGNITNDSDGNMLWGPLTNDTFANYTFDSRNRLVRTTSTSSFDFAYDALGNRLAITNGTNLTRFVINPNAKLSQDLIRVKNGVTNYYVYGLGLLYEADDAGNTKQYHYDLRGSTVALTDGSGNLTDRMEYSAYGMTTYRSGSTDTPFLFNGRYGVMTDPNGLLFMRARYYNPYICRFINADPSGFAGGLNWYAYADGNPVSNLDPFGLQSWMSPGYGAIPNPTFGPVVSSPLSLGVVATVSVEGGYTSGGGAQYSHGAGVFIPANNDVSIGGFRSGGASSGSPGEGLFGSSGAVNAVESPTGADPVFMGSSFGGSTGVWLSNAGQASALGGPFDQWNFNALNFSFSFAKAGDIWIASLTYGLPAVSYGNSISKYPTTTFDAGGVSISGHADSYKPDK